MTANRAARLVIFSRPAGAKRRKLRHLQSSIFAGLFALPAVPASGQSGTDGAVNTGNDVTQPIHRVDILANYTRPDHGINAWTATLRYERPFYFDDGWKLALRFEAPVVISNDPSPGNSARNYQSGLGDTLYQFAFSRMLDGENGFGFGLRILAPSATEPELGNGRWRALPILGVRYGLSAISPGSYFQPLVRYQFDFAGDDSRRHSSDIQFSPSLNFALPQKSYVTLFPSADVRYSFINKEWFVPFNVEVGREWWTNFVTSLELGVPLIYGDHPVYLFKLEGRASYRF